jgi:hypothetical protein
LASAASLLRPLHDGFFLLGGVVHLHLLFTLGLVNLLIVVDSRKIKKLDLSALLADGHRLGLLLEQVDGLASFAYRMS